VAGRPSHEWMLRACFALFGAVVLLQALWVSIAAIGCVLLIFRGSVVVGECADVSARAREVFAEMLAGILALLLAGRPPPEEK
jgi:hypothetical protein